MIKIEEILKNDYEKWKNREYIFEKKNEKYEDEKITKHNIQILKKDIVKEKN